MKQITEVANSWGSFDALLESAEDDTLDALIQYLQKLKRRAKNKHNARLVVSETEYDDWNDVGTLALVYDRDETPEEAEAREAKQQKQDRLFYLRELAQHYRPRRGAQENAEEWKLDQAMLIQQRGWDKLQNEDLKQLVVALPEDKKAT